ncbi:hypothetical protein AB870_16870 [Pandoraea faecigallinarum]|uniref:Uncharacterized protein n=2 Tax=Pandoraea faecigallinarum TaxID=656179 RepID=A0A0H3WXQ8_9BURK|nr:hypothetical protein AB870_16870 [Pandoraea faecigallinarum]
MTLRGGNPQALMLPSQCLHHYHVDPHADAGEARAEATRRRALARVGQWLRAFVHRREPVRRG